LSGGEGRLGGIIDGRQENLNWTSRGGGAENEIVTTHEVDLAIGSLLGSVSSIVARNGKGVDSLNYSDGTSSSCVMRGIQESSLRHVSSTLESQVLTPYGKYGGKIFKYAKMCLWLRNVGVAVASDRPQDVVTRNSGRFVRELIVREGHKLQLAFLQ